MKACLEECPFKDIELVNRDRKEVLTLSDGKFALVSHTGSGPIRIGLPLSCYNLFGNDTGECNKVV